MRSLAAALDGLLSAEEAARGESPVHELDSRAKVLVTALFVVLVASFPARAVAPLLPFLLFPVVLAARGGVPAAFLGARLLVPLPFVLLLALPALVLEPGETGWRSAASILLRYAATASAALVLLATTGIAGVASALRSLGVPRALVTQLLVLVRYLFVLGEETLRMDRARQQRSFGGRGLGLAGAGPFLGTLLLRSWDRADRVHRAMRARGFDGTLPDSRPKRFGAAEALFVAGWSALLVALRIVDVPALLGHAARSAFAAAGVP